MAVEEVGTDINTLIKGQSDISSLSVQPADESQIPYTWLLAKPVALQSELELLARLPCKSAVSTGRLPERPVSWWPRQPLQRP